ncbi:hypothetical protein SH467x_000840 [Pirellulaceae bacterium SH467]
MVQTRAKARGKRDRYEQLSYLTKPPALRAKISFEEQVRFDSDYICCSI